MKLEEMRVNELQAKYKELCGGPTKCPNKVFLIRKIKEAMAARKKAKAGANAKGASIEELRARYEEIVGRATTSNDRAYLLWKIAMAKRGKVRVGPALPRSAGPHTMVPLRIETALVEVLDKVWRRHGLRSRNALLCAAIQRELVARGERDAASRFGSTE
jgi:hypothetical protein